MKPDLTSSHVKGRTSTARVVVVGAGVAGVGAAGALLAGGISDVILLEAADQPGGRVRSAVLEGGFVELGAEFIHGRNDIFHIAEREGLLADQDSDGDDELPDSLLQYRDFTFRSSDGRTVGPHIVLHNLQVLEGLHEASVELPRTEAAQDVNVSVGDFYRESFRRCKDTLKGSEDLKAAMFRWVDAWECQDTGGTVDQLSFPGSGQYVYCPGNGTRDTTAGIAEVFNSLLKETVPAQHIRLNKAVIRIHWSDEDSVLRADQGTDTPQTALLEATLDGWTVLDKSQVCINNNVISTPPLPPDELQAGETATDEAVRPEKALVFTNPMWDHSCRTQGHPLTERALVFTNPMWDHSSRTQGHPLTEDGRSGRTGKGGGVRIECEDGEEIYADHVIVTASMGFLKEHPELFVPALPAGHREGIKSIGFGDVAKAFLFWEGEEGSALRKCLPCVCSPTSRWRRRMLGSDVGGVIPLWMREARPKLESARYRKTMSNGRHWYEDVCMFTVTKSHDYCIAAWVGSEAAVLMETLPESEVKEVLYELLAFFLGKPDLPAPCRIIRTQWYSNPYTRGAYSYLTTGMTLDLQQLLQQPLPSWKRPVVQLAGEACSKHYYSTLHGALQSGRQAAQVILHHHNLSQS